MSDIVEPSAKRITDQRPRSGGVMPGAHATVRMAPFVIAVLGALAVLAIALAWNRLAHWSRAQFPMLQSTVLAPSATGAAAGGNVGWIAAAMAECEAESKRNLDSLYFLIIPVVPSDQKGHSPASSGDATGNNWIQLLGSRQTLDGLKDGGMAIYRGRFDFSIVETTTDVAYIWKPAVGVSKFVTRNGDAIHQFKAKFKMPDVHGDAEWASNEIFARTAGTCYWTGALIRS